MDMGLGSNYNFNGEYLLPSTFDESHAGDVKAVQSLKDNSTLVCEYVRDETICPETYSKQLEQKNFFYEYSYKGYYYREVSDQHSAIDKSSSRIEYNFITGDMTITGEINRFYSMLRTYGIWRSMETGEPGPGIDPPHTLPDTIKVTWELKLKNVSPLLFTEEAQYPKYFFLKTANSSGTQQVIESLTSHTTRSRVVPWNSSYPPEFRLREEDYSVTGIDYNRGEVVLRIAFEKR